MNKEEIKIPLCWYEENYPILRDNYNKCVRSFKDLQNELDKSNNKIEKIKEYCKDINNDCKNDFTYAGMAVANNILSIIDGSDE